MNPLATLCLLSAGFFGAGLATGPALLAAALATLVGALLCDVKQTDQDID